MKRGSVDSIESMGLFDGPGIRAVVFLNGCTLRCKYCHNPEMWVKGKDNMTSEELVDKLLRLKPYFGKNGGVTFSGGEPLLQIDFLLEVCRLLKKEHVHIALDTAGVGLGKYSSLLQVLDLVILDIKHVDLDGYYALTGMKLREFDRFVEELNRSGVPVWLRQVIVPGIHDNIEYMKALSCYCDKIQNVSKIEFLPFHRLGEEKYVKLGIPYPYQDIPSMDPSVCDEWYQRFLDLRNRK